MSSKVEAGEGDDEMQASCVTENVDRIGEMAFQAEIERIVPLAIDAFHLHDMAFQVASVDKLGENKMTLRDT